MPKELQTEQPSCPAGCCTGNEILCVSIPCPIDIVLLDRSIVAGSDWAPWKPGRYSRWSSSRSKVIRLFIKKESPNW